MPGSGTMTPITGGPPGAAPLATPFPYTLLSVGRYASIMGINPVHFWGATAAEINPMVMPVTSCATVWRKYDWQNADQISRCSVVAAIKQAEYDIARVLGFFPGPMWLVEEEHRYPQPYRPVYTSGNGLDTTMRMKTVNSDYGKVIETGQRAVSYIGSATIPTHSLVYTDEDGDGFYETATITLALTSDATDVREIKVYHTGTGGNQEWEIRPVRYKAIVGPNVQIVLDSWLLINPNLYEALPTEDQTPAIDISTLANFLTTVDVYREYVDHTLPSSQFIWETDMRAGCSFCGGAGCEDCSPTTQDGCATIRDTNLGIITPFPASYDRATASWSRDLWAEGREPERVKLWYYAGEVDQWHLKSIRLDPLSDEWATVIAWLATARMRKQPCGCGNVQTIMTELMTDVSRSSRETGSFFPTPSMMTSPFGTRKGEVMAWERISRQVTRKFKYALV